MREYVRANFQNLRTFSLVLNVNTCSMQYSIVMSNNTVRTTFWMLMNSIVWHVVGGCSLY